MESGFDMKFHDISIKRFQFSLTPVTETDTEYWEKPEINLLLISVHTDVLVFIANFLLLFEI